MNDFPKKFFKPLVRRQQELQRRVDFNDGSENALQYMRAELVALNRAIPILQKYYDTNMIISQRMADKLQNADTEQPQE